MWIQPSLIYLHITFLLDHVTAVCQFHGNVYLVCFLFCLFLFVFVARNALLLMTHFFVWRLVLRVETLAFSSDCSVSPEFMLYLVLFLFSFSLVVVYKVRS